MRIVAEHSVLIAIILLGAMLGIAYAIDRENIKDKAIEIFILFITTFLGVVFALQQAS